MWFIDPDNPASLRNGAGEVFQLPYRKAGVVLLRLAEADGAAVPRLNLARDLWPGVPEREALQSLRQSIWRIRKALGTAAVQGDRSHFWLSSHKNLEFEVLRPEREPELLAPVTAFISLVHWAKFNAQDRLLHLFRFGAEYVTAVSKSELSQLCQLVAEPFEDENTQGWSLFWLGYQQLFVSLPSAHRLLLSAFRIGRRHRDQLLLESACYWLGVGCLLLNRCGEARTYMERCQMEASHGRSRSFSRRIEGLRATILMHEGRLDQGLKVFEELSLTEPSLDPQYQVDESLRAFFLALAGRYGQARAVLAQQNQANSVRHHSITSFSNVAAAICDAAAGDPRGAERLSRLASYYRKASEPYMELYCRESLAEMHQQAGNPDAAAGEWRLAAALRNRLGAKLTAWDRSRLPTFAGN